jgi:ABC-type branched-subunit amino acid transport system substrate-binding protein
VTDSYLRDLPELERAVLTRLNARGLARLGECLSTGESIAFLGAGASAPLYPPWPDVIGELIDASADHLTGAAAATARELAATSPDAAVDVIRQTLRPDVYREVLREVFRVRRDRVTGVTWTPTQELVVRCNFRAVVTTNADPGIVDARARWRPGASTAAASWSDETALESWQTGDVFRGGHELPVLFAHGHHSHPDELVLATTEYRRAYGGGLGRVLRTLVSDGLVVWVGFSFEDHRIPAILREIAGDSPTRVSPGSTPRPIALMPWDLEPPGAVERRDPRRLQQMCEIQYGSDVVLYPVRGGDHSRLAALLEPFTDARFARVADRDADLPTPVAGPERITTSAARATRVFLCHASADKAEVRALYHRLVQDGYTPWLDEEDLLPGQMWASTIRNAVRDSDFVVVCLSKTSVTRAGFVQKEIKQALDVADEQPEGTIFVIPVRLEDCKVPERLRDLHWVDLFADGGYARLARALTLTGRTTGSSPAPRPGERSSVPAEAPQPPEDERSGAGARPGEGEDVSVARRPPESPEGTQRADLRANPPRPTVTEMAAEVPTPTLEGPQRRIRRALAGGLAQLKDRWVPAVVAVLVLGSLLVGVGVLLDGGAGGGHPGGANGLLPGNAPPTPVTIGTVFPRTGVDRAASQEALDGVEYALYYINNGRDPGSTLPLKAGLGLTNPAFHGAKLSLLASVDPGDRCNTQSAFRMLVDGHPDVAGVVGARDSTYTLQAIIAADALRVPLVNDSSSAPTLTATAGQHPTPCQDTPYGNTLTPASPPWFFRPGANDAEAAKEFFQVIADAQSSGKIKPVRRMAMLYEKNDIFGDEAFHATQHEAGTVYPGITVMGASYPSAVPLAGSAMSADPCARAPELRRAVEKIQNDDNPDVLFVAGYEPDAVATLQTMQALGYTPPALLAYGGGWEGRDFIHDVGTPHPKCGLPRANASGIIVRTGWARDVSNPTPMAVRVARLFQQHKHRAMSATAAAGFTAMMTLAQAINAAGTTDHAAVRAALSAIMETSKTGTANTTIMPWPGIDFTDGTGQNSAAQFVLQQIIHGDHYVAIYPDKGPYRVATNTPIWPLAAAPRDSIGPPTSWWAYLVGLAVLVAAGAALLWSRHKRGDSRGLPTS